MKTLLALAILAASVLTSAAQISVHLKMDRTTYLANEQVSAVITLTNRSGRELFLRTVPKGRTTRSWLDFSIRDGRGKDLHQRRAPQYRAAKIPAGQSVAKRVIFNNLFGVNNPDRYAATAHITTDEGVTYQSNSAYFNVNNGRVLFSEQFGAPGTKYPKRAYQVLSFNDGKRTSLYTTILENRTKASLSTSRLSEALLFNKPQATIDGKSRLHVLYLATPEVFVHVITNQDGGRVNTQYYKRANSGIPSFTAFANGEIKVRGGIPFDPQKEAKEKSRARRITERPK